MRNFLLNKTSRIAVFGGGIVMPHPTKPDKKISFQPYFSIK